MGMYAAWRFSAFDNTVLHEISSKHRIRLYLRENHIYPILPFGDVIATEYQTLLYSYTKVIIMMLTQKFSILKNLFVQNKTALPY